MSSLPCIIQSKFKRQMNSSSSSHVLFSFLSNVVTPAMLRSFSVSSGKTLRVFFSVPCSSRFFSLLLLRQLCCANRFSFLHQGPSLPLAFFPHASPFSVDRWCVSAALVQHNTLPGGAVAAAGARGERSRGVQGSWGRKPALLSPVAAGRVGTWYINQLRFFLSSLCCHLLCIWWHKEMIYGI